MKIGELSKRTGITPEAIRFYEKTGLLLKADRNQENRYRTYISADINRIRFIHNLKDLGFTLSEIKEIFSYYEDRAHICSQVEIALTRHLARLENKLQNLRIIRRKVTAAISTCRENPKAISCVTLDRLWE